MVYLIGIDYNKLLSVDLAFRESYICLVSTDFDHTGCLITLSDRNGPILDLVYPILTVFLN